MTTIQPSIIITGGSKGIGLAIVKTLLSKFNANVLSISRSRTPGLDELSKSYPKSLTVKLCDVTDEAAISSIVASCERIDGMILNVGTVFFGRVDAVDAVATWKHLFDVNLFSFLPVIRTALPRLREVKGRIVLISSAAAVGGTAGWGAYNASKAAMNGLCRTLANEEPNVTCVALHPGVVDTDMQRSLREEAQGSMSPGEYNYFVQAHDNGKLLKPEAPSHVLAALAIKASHDLTGKFHSWDDEELRKYRE